MTYTQPIARWVLAALLLLACVPAMAQRIVIQDPWPDPESVTGVHATDVTFPSASPFTPSEMGRTDTEKTTGVARLFMPEHASPHTTPAVILLHGAAGLLRERTLYGPQLASMGVAVLVIDTFGARRDKATSFTERLIQITESMMVNDAYAGLKFLATLPEIDPHRVVLGGFSYGGMSSMYAMYRQLADRLAPPELRFVGHVDFYGPCIARFEDNRTTGAPLLIMNGQLDELTIPSRCEEIANELRAGGSDVQMVTYEGAVHQWDGGQPLRRIGRNLAPCDFRVERDLTIRDKSTVMAMSNSFVRRLILGMCTEAKPYPVGRDDAIRAKSNHDLGAFLMRVFNGDEH